MLKNLLLFPDGTEVFSGPGEENAIVSVTVTECVNAGAELTLGSVCAAMLEATLIAPGLSAAAGDEVTLYKVDSSGTRTQAGVFTLEKPTRSGARLKLTAYDRVSRLDKDLTDWLSALDGWPYGLYEFAERVCDACGLVLANDTLPNGDYEIPKFSAQGITGRQLMAWIGQACAQFCRATPQGLIEFAWYQAAAASISPDGDRFFYRGSLSYEDYTVAPIGKVQIRLTDTDVGVIYPDTAGEANTYTVTGNYLLTAATSDALLPIAQRLYQTLSAVSYTPCKLSIPACLDIRAGNTLSVTDANGNTITAYVMTKTQSGQKDTLECTGAASRDSTTAVNAASFKALSGKVLNLQTSVEGLKAENADTEGRLAKLEMDVENISLSVSETVKTEVQDAVSEIEVGGRNLLLGTKDWSDSAFYIDGVYGPPAGAIADGVLTVPINSSTIDTHFVSVQAGEVYTISVDIKSTEAYQGNTILLQYYDDEGVRQSYVWVTANVSDDWSRLSGTFTIPDGISQFRAGLRSSAGYVNCYRLIKLETGTVNTDWTPAPEDVDGAVDRAQSAADAAQADVDNLTNSTTQKIAELEVTADSITSEVSKQTTRVDQMEESLSALQQTADSFSIEFQNIKDNGVDRVTTSTGYTFNADGLTIAKSGQEMENRLDNTGMYVTRSGETILQANNEGVVAADVTVRNYLVVGSHARFEDYGTDRTACFFI